MCGDYDSERYGELVEPRQAMSGNSFVSLSIGA